MVDVGKVRLLFLDRDGTLNRTLSGRPPNRPDEVELLPNVGPVLSRYVAEGWQLVVVSNQGGVASGFITEETAYAIQDRVIGLLPVPVAASYLCPHMPNATVPEYRLDCPNRKPKPGFILAALARFNAQAQDCLFVGDMSSDRQAAETARVPFRWADRFFERPINRGLMARDSRVVRLREAVDLDAEAMAALIRRVDGAGAAKMLERLQGTVPDEASTDEGGEERASPDLLLLAAQKDRTVGWLALLRRRTPGNAGAADLGLGVEPDSHGLGIDTLLVETGLEWARWQPELKRVCIEVPEENAPVSALCCALGFSEEGRGTRRRDGGAESVTSLACDL